MYPLGLAGLVAAVLFVAPARAETLLEALSAAYRFNPRLDAARAILRATDEEVPRALARYWPSVTGGCFLVGAHGSAAACNVGGKDSGQPAGTQGRSERVELQVDGTAT